MMDDALKVVAPEAVKVAFRKVVKLLGPPVDRENMRSKIEQADEAVLEKLKAILTESGLCGPEGLRAPNAGVQFSGDINGPVYVNVMYGGTGQSPRPYEGLRSPRERAVDAFRRVREAKGIRGKHRISRTSRRPR